MRHINSVKNFIQNFMNGKKHFSIAIAIVFAIIIISIYLYMASHYVSTDNARVKIANIQLVAEVSGYVTAIHYTENAFVHANDVIIEIDKQKYNFNNDRAIASFEYFKSEYERKSKLVKNNFISDEDLNKAKYAFEMAKVNYANAKYNLDKSNIEARTDGVLTNFDIKIGDYIAAGRPLFNVINKKDIWIEANFKEVEIEHIKKGQKAEIVLDTFPHEKWYANVESITPATGAEFSLIPAQNFSGNWIKVSQRITVRLEFVGGQDLSKLASGMSAEVTIKIR